MRGDVYRLRPSKRTRGHEQDETRYCVIVQADYLPLSTVIAVPTSTQARSSSFRPEIMVLNGQTRALAEQVAAMDLSRLGDQVGRVTPEELEEIDRALLDVLGL